MTFTEISNALCTQNIIADAEDGKGLVIFVSSHGYDDLMLFEAMDDLVRFVSDGCQIPSAVEIALSVQLPELKDQTPEAWIMQDRLPAVQGAVREALTEYGRIRKAVASLLAAEEPIAA